MITLKLEFELWCPCGEKLKFQADLKSGLTITPCQKCLDRAEIKGFNEGYDKGYSDGWKKSGSRKLN